MITHCNLLVEIKRCIAGMQHAEHAACLSDQPYSMQVIKHQLFNQSFADTSGSQPSATQDTLQATAADSQPPPPATSDNAAGVAPMES